MAMQFEDVIFPPLDEEKETIRLGKACKLILFKQCFSSCLLGANERKDFQETTIFRKSNLVVRSPQQS